jgi:hypothetical protein
MEKRGDGLEPRLPGARPTHTTLTPPSPSTVPPGAHPTHAALTPPSHRYGPCPPRLGAGATGSWPSQLGGEGDDEEQRQEEDIEVAPGRSGDGAAAARRPSAPLPVV